MLSLQHPLMPTRRQLALFLGASTLSTLAPANPTAPSTDWQEHTTETPDGPLAYARAGQGPLLVLLPGGPGGSGWALRHWSASLTDHFTVVVLDNIGRGRSERLADPRRYTLARDVEDLERLRQHLGQERLCVYGHSYGGLLAQAWGAAHPQRVRGLILGNTLHGARAWQEQLERCKAQVRFQHPAVWAQWQADRARGLRSDRDAFDTLLSPCLDTLYWHNPEHAGRKPPVGPPPSPQPERDRLNRTVYLAMLGDDPEWEVGGTLAGVEMLPQLPRIQAPALVLSGRADRICPPSAAQEIASVLPQAQCHVFEGSGHRPFVEEPEAWALRVAGFGRSLD
ncbi:alpha/beta fold hydrolase [Inhella proteolytica]|uniref:Alpha/beta fold hydrolase n=1 Tax=Inhella proteolytica TaxID=2795029 RepID=A0A931J4W5_9BURK|nr:alpha/beta hydrolase [Inhella proteolytica]MBH9576912.1 alpha/beta fold hydrolase [Inhella proteolytica]